MGSGDFIHGGPVDCDDVARIRSIVMFEEPERTKRVVRFAVLLVLASAIATYGLIADSVATVIGAMIVAPLMLPIMGLAFGISIGERRAIATSLIVSLGGIATAVLVGYLLALPYSHILDPTSNAQIMARTAPRLVDLLAALATGLAGAFAISRADVSDTLPGVAIAISLVPPLANVGILLAVGRRDLALGSMTLFVTNFLAIALTGALLFAWLGFPRLVFSERAPGTRRAGIIIAVLLTVIICVPLSISGYQALQKNQIEQRLATAADSWLAGSDYRFVSATAGEPARLVITGTGAPPKAEQLQARLKGRLFGRGVVVEIVPKDTVTVSTQ